MMSPNCEDVRQASTICSNQARGLGESGTFQGQHGTGLKHVSRLARRSHRGVLIISTITVLSDQYQRSSNALPNMELMMLMIIITCKMGMAGRYSGDFGDLAIVVELFFDLG